MSTIPLTDVRLTIDEFLASTDERPDSEKWELIEGVACMSPSPTDVHQMIVTNITSWLANEKLRTGPAWVALTGVGTLVPNSPHSLPHPDVFVKAGPLTGKPTTGDALVLFEILSPSNTQRDQAWRRKVYASVPNCQHYVTLSQSEVTATRNDRADAWAGSTVAGIEAAVHLPALGPDVTIPLTEAYRWTPFGPA
jgi:Uma2 family endonuclease